MLAQVHEKLAGLGVETASLACVALTDTEMLIGEVYDHKDYMDGESHASIFQHAPFISLRNPKRFSRLPFQNRETGQYGVQLQLADFDFMESGVVEVKPAMAFFFDWCDFGTQLRYCRALLGFLEGKRRKQSRIVVPTGPIIADIKR